ncbi:MAG: hypothetical protein HZB68_02795 [Candidatus Aenigmarchaeota archaeon]|nr:hypothetical protein [Candidatus Aenigmarchaeota archaeon]
MRDGDVKRWKRKSIETARELSLFDETVYGKLENVEIKIKTGKRPKGVWFGYAFDDCHIEVYSKNYSSYMPFIGEEANQSGIDQGSKWKLITKAIPFIQKRHKGVDLI